MEKDAILHLRITAKQKEKIDVEAKKQKINGPQYVRDAIEFYADLDHYFLRHIRATAEGLHMPYGVFVQQLLQTYIALDTARIINSPEQDDHVYSLAFQFDGDGLIVGRKHFDMVLNGEKEAIALRKKSKEARNVHGQGVKPEVRVRPMASAKSK